MAGRSDVAKRFSGLMPIRKKKIVSTDAYEDPAYHFHEQEWYRNSIQSNKVVHTAPYFDEALGEMFISFGTQIVKDSKPIGVITGDYVLDSIQSIVSDVKIERVVMHL